MSQLTHEKSSQVSGCLPTVDREFASTIEAGVTALEKLKKQGVCLSDLSMFDYAKNVLREMSAWIGCKSGNDEQGAFMHQMTAFMNEERLWFCRELQNRSSERMRIRIQIDAGNSWTCTVDEFATTFRTLVNRTLLHDPVDDVRRHTLSTAQLCIDLLEKGQSRGGLAKK